MSETLGERIREQVDALGRERDGACRRVLTAERAAGALRARIAELEARCTALALLVDELRWEPCGRCEAATTPTTEATK